ncbi:MAG: translation initiation factor IF-1 [Clostridia bacterium]|nr:translation initiation factor IF-1 [Clostridia bacterium]
MASEDLIKMTGVVTKADTGMNFKVQLPNGKIISTYVAGKLIKSKLKILVGDYVDVEISPYDLTKGRIVYRYTDNPNK